MITGICNLMTVSTTSTFSLLWYMFLKKTADFNDPPSSLGPHLILTLPPSPPSKSVVFSPLSGVCLTGSNSISYYCGYFASSIKPAHKDCIFCFWRQFTFMVDLQPSSFFFFLVIQYALTYLTALSQIIVFNVFFMLLTKISFLSGLTHLALVNLRAHSVRHPTVFTFIFMVCAFTVNQGEHVPGCYDPTWGCLNCTMMTTHKHIAR